MADSSANAALLQHIVDDGNILSGIEDMDHVDLQLTTPAEEDEDCSPEDKLDFHAPLKDMVLSLNRIICRKLDTMEVRVDTLTDLCANLEAKADAVLSAFRDHTSQTEGDGSKMGQTVIVGVPQAKASASVANVVGPNVTLITLNTEEDFPNGSWLGDEGDPEMRVRTHLNQSDMLHINTTCLTPEKMALTLLDYLFDRETQACSNISGTGKHHKRQLDPLLIYGIRCHLIKQFQLTEKGWHRIRQNIDSKCRTAFRRKTKAEYHEKKKKKPLLTLAPTTISEELAAMVHESRVVRTPSGEIQVVQATPQQIARIQNELKFILMK